MNRRAVTGSALLVDVRLPERGVDVTLEVPAGHTLALLGANGAGKSTVVESVAGLVSPYDGQVRVGERVLTRVTEGRQQTWVAPHDRHVGLLAQEARLFPHLTASANVAFGPRSRGASRGEAARTAERWLAQVGLEGYGHRRPRQLSGGQAQRAALARVLAADPHVVLLDEPLAALDVDVAPDLRHLLREVLEGRTTVVVTHDVLDALLLADSVAVLEAGRVVEHGPTRQVLSRPRSRFGARIAGLNLVAGTWDGAALRTPTGAAVHGLLESESTPPTNGSAVVAVFRPAAVAVHPDSERAGPASPRNSFAVTIETLEPYGDLLRVRGGDLHADVTAAAVADLGLVPGQSARFVVKAAEVQLHPA